MKTTSTYEGTTVLVCPQCGTTVVRMWLSVTNDLTDGPIWYRCHDCKWEGNHPDQVYRTIAGDFPIQEDPR